MISWRRTRTRCQPSTEENIWKERLKVGLAADNVHQYIIYIIYNFCTYFSILSLALGKPQKNIFFNESAIIGVNPPSPQAKLQSKQKKIFYSLMERPLYPQMALPIKRKKKKKHAASHKCALCLAIFSA